LNRPEDSFFDGFTDLTIADDITVSSQGLEDITVVNDTPNINVTSERLDGITVFDMDFDAQFEDGAVNGTDAWARGFYTLDLTPRAGGDTVSIRGKFMNTFRQEGNGDWKYTGLIWNADAPVAFE
jgi:hypothetical protein